nr:ABC transporter permease [Desulfosporosinus sp.]
MVCFFNHVSNIVWLFWQEVIKDPFVCLFHWLPESKIAAMSKAIFLMALPGQLILGVVVAAKTHSWLGGLVMVPITVLTGYYIARKISLKS